MKISTQTLSILESFKHINSNLVVRAGSTISICNIEKTLLGYFQAEEVFPAFSIYDLKEFMSIVGLFKSPEFTFNDDTVDIVEKNKKTHYIFSDPTTFRRVPPESITHPEFEVSFILSQEDLNSMLKAAGIFQFKYITVTSNEAGNILIATENLDSPASAYELELDSETDLTGIDFKVIIDTELFKIIGGSYKFQLSSKKLIMLENQTLPLTYYMSAEENTYFKKSDE